MLATWVGTCTMLMDDFSPYLQFTAEKRNHEGIALLATAKKKRKLPLCVPEMKMGQSNLYLHIDSTQARSPGCPVTPRAMAFYSQPQPTQVSLAMWRNTPNQIWSRPQKSYITFVKLHVKKNEKRHVKKMTSLICCQLTLHQAVVWQGGCFCLRNCMAKTWINVKRCVCFRADKKQSH